MHATVHTAIPFFGLGFDMRPALARAKSLSASSVAFRTAAPTSGSPWSFAPALLWGYALLVALSRETRAG